MSVLATAVEARVPTQRLVQLTNKNSRAATTIDSTTLEAAVDDTSAEFGIRAGETFDSANATHVRLAVPGVVAFLCLWNGQEDGQKQIDRFTRMCEDYRATRSNKRITPITDRTVGPSPDVSSDGTGRRPEFDAPRFSRLDVAAPRDTGTGIGSGS